MNYKINHIPRSTQGNKRPGILMKPEYITIHSTANPKSTAMNERDWLVNNLNKGSASWHIVIDDKEAIEAIPISEVAYHAGNAAGNRNSIGVEICESGDREKTLENAANLVAKLLRERGWGVDRLRRHYDWSGKHCPRIMSKNNWAGWTAFKKEVEVRLAELKKIEIYFMGKKEQGLLINGTTYIPLRKFAEHFGVKVDYKDGKVYVG